MAVTRRSLLIAGTAAPMPAHDPAYDDSARREVAVPHDWSIELTPTTDHGTSGGTGFLPGGLGWYRTTFTLPRALEAKRISVEFDGVYMDSSVYCNGRLLGEHPYGYTGFALDLTEVAHTDGATPNVLAVKVRNRLPSSRWYSGSGIYRHARLVVTDPVHVARWGTYITTGWSNAFRKPATALLPAFDGARKADWVSVTWSGRRRLRRVEVSFTVDATHTLPASIEVSAWNGHAYGPVRGASITWATASDTPTVITFDPVRTSRLRLDLASRHPGAADGAQRIVALEAGDG